MTELYFSPSKTVEEIKEGRRSIQYLGFPVAVKSDVIKSITLTQENTKDHTEEYLIVFDLNFSKTAALLVENALKKEFTKDTIEYDNIMDYDGKYHPTLIWVHIK